MLRTETRSIDGLEVMVTEFPGREGFLIKAHIVKMLAPVLGAAKVDGKSLDMSFMDLDLGRVASSILETIDEDEFLTFLLRIFRATRINGRELTAQVFDEVFVGEHVATVYKVLAYALEVNYKPFFDLLKGSAANLKAAAVKGPSKPALRDLIPSQV